MFAFAKKLKSLLPSERTLPGRSTPIPVPEKHFVNGHPLKAPFPAGMQLAQFGMGHRPDGVARRHIARGRALQQTGQRGGFGLHVALFAKVTGRFCRNGIAVTTVRVLTRNRRYAQT